MKINKNIIVALLCAVTFSGNIFPGIFDTITPAVKTFATELSSPNAENMYPNFADSFIFEGCEPSTVQFSDLSDSIRSLFLQSNAGLPQSRMNTLGLNGLKDQFIGSTKNIFGTIKDSGLLQNYYFTRGLALGGASLTAVLVWYYWDKIADIQRRVKKVEKTVNDTNKRVKENAFRKVK